MNERYIKWYTPYLSREFEMLVFGNGGLPLILFPTSFGSYYQNKDFGLVDAVAGYVETRSIWKVSTIKEFIPPTECGRTTPTKT